MQILPEEIKSMSDDDLTVLANVLREEQYKRAYERRAARKEEMTETAKDFAAVPNAITAKVTSILGSFASELQKFGKDYRNG